MENDENIKDNNIIDNSELILKKWISIGLCWTIFK